MSNRKILTPEQKIAIIREHLLGKLPVADLCANTALVITSKFNFPGRHVCRIACVLHDF